MLVPAHGFARRGWLRAALLQGTMTGNSAENGTMTGNSVHIAVKNGSILGGDAGKCPKMTET